MSVMYRDPQVNITLMGGLGNHLFQLAFAHHVTCSSGREVILNTLNGSVRNMDNGRPELSVYNLKFTVDHDYKDSFGIFLGRIIGVSIRLNLLPRKSVSSKMAILFLKFAGNLVGSLKYLKLTSTYYSKDIGFDSWKPKPWNEICTGYFQTFRWAQTEEVKQQMINLKPEVEEGDVVKYRNLARIEKPLLVHIRLSDYRSEPKIGILSPNYYKVAISQQLATGRFGKIWVFSDEIEEVEEYIPREYMHLVRPIQAVGTNSGSLLEVMRMCHGYVIANSSLSWWSAFLSYNPDCKVIYPNPWFAGMNTPIDLIPESWTPIAR